MSSFHELIVRNDSAKNASNTNVHIMLLTDGQSNDDPFFELKRFCIILNIKRSRFSKFWKEAKGTKRGLNLFASLIRDESGDE